MDRTERDAAGTVRRNERMKECEGGRSGTKETEQPRERDRDARMNRQNNVESEQMLRTERSNWSIYKKGMILLFDSSILQGDCHFVEEFFNLEPRRIKNDQRNGENYEVVRDTSKKFDKNRTVVHRVVNKFSHFSVSIQQTNVTGISVYCIIEIFVLLICRKFHPFSPRLRYFSEVTSSVITPTKLSQRAAVLSM